MTGYEFWGYIHILLLVFWLGGDIGVFINAKIAKTTLYSVETRAALLKTGGITDLFPRYCFALIFPSGLTLVDAMGMYSPPLWGLVGAWIVGAVWVWAIWTAHATPKWGGLKAYMKIQFWGEAVLGVLFIGAALMSFATDSPVAENWLAAKILLLGILCFVAMWLEVTARPFGAAFMEVTTQGSTPERETRVNAAMNRVLGVVLVIYAILFIVALIGRVKPFG